MAVSIASSIVATLKFFNEIIAIVKNTMSSDISGLSVGGWEDELGRLRVWAANIGAHQTNQSSLDFRLRDSSHIRDQSLKLLESLRGRLDDARNILTEGSESDDEASLDHVSDDEVPLTEMEELHKTIASIIKSLFLMSMLVRKPARRDLRAGSSRADVAAFEPYDYGHVRDKYPGANETLVLRLGYAITQRRRYLRYRERHAAKLRQGIGNVFTRAQGAASEGAATVLSDTVASDVHDVDFDERASYSGESQTSYAATLMTGKHITIPPPPKESRGGSPFECPLCYHLIKIESTQSWNKHIFLDLLPYLCLEIDCITPQKLYATRHEWLHHLEIAHPGRISTSTGSIQQEAADCPLCAETFQHEAQYDTHIARHLQDLALFALPSSLQDVEEDSDLTSSQGLLERKADSFRDESSTAELASGTHSPHKSPHTKGSSREPNSSDEEENDIDSARSVMGEADPHDYRHLFGLTHKTPNFADEPPNKDARRHSNLLGGTPGSMVDEVPRPRDEPPETGEYTAAAKSRRRPHLLGDAKKGITEEVKELENRRIKTFSELNPLSYTRSSLSGFPKLRDASERQGAYGKRYWD